MKTALYRHYDEHGLLLYVGISFSAVIRLSSHRSNAPWYSEIAKVTIEWFPTRLEAEAAERRAIKEELPKYNGGSLKFGKDTAGYWYKKVFQRSNGGFHIQFRLHGKQQRFALNTWIRREAAERAAAVYRSRRSNTGYVIPAF